jgi:hypothetical protein
MLQAPLGSGSGTRPQAPLPNRPGYSQSQSLPGKLFQQAASCKPENLNLHHRRFASPGHSFASTLTDQRTKTPPHKNGPRVSSLISIIDFPISFP